MSSKSAKAARKARVPLPMPAKSPKPQNLISFHNENENLEVLNLEKISYGQFYPAAGEADAVVTIKLCDGKAPRNYHGDVAENIAAHLLMASKDCDDAAEWFRGYFKVEHVGWKPLDPVDPESADAQEAAPIGATPPAAEQLEETPAAEGPMDPRLPPNAHYCPKCGFEMLYESELARNRCDLCEEGIARTPVDTSGGSNEETK
jgi:hypothetical protein